MRITANGTSGAQTAGGSPTSSEGHAIREDLANALVRELARALPAALDQATLEELASKLCPYLTQAIQLSSEGQLLTCADAARRAHVHVETVRRAIRAGSLPVAARIGRSPRLSIVAVDGWLAASSENHSQQRAIRRRTSSSVSTVGEKYSLTAAFEATG